MRLIIFSDNAETKKKFPHLQKSKAVEIAFLPLNDFQTAKSLNKDTLYYYDLAKLEEVKRKKLLRQLLKLKGYHIGIIDPKNTIKDVAGLFHAGIVDYLEKNTLAAGIKYARIKNILEFAGLSANVAEKDDFVVKFDQSKLSGDNWKNIHRGKTYIFTFMFFEIDKARELKDKLGQKKFEEIINSIRKYLEKEIDPLQGRIWIWSETGGIILFPFDGSSCPALLLCMTIILNRRLISIEELKSEFLFSFRLAIHIGETTYQTRGQTNTIISDSVNSIFHLGQRFAEPGYLYITDAVVAFIPPKAQELFRDAGKFEGRAIRQMKQLP